MLIISCAYEQLIYKQKDEFFSFLFRYKRKGWQESA